MTIKYFENVEQGSDAWLAMRCGLLTASEMKHVITPKYSVANNQKTRSHAYELLAQRITGFVESNYVSDDMLRGIEDEIEARIKYEENYAPVKEVGFITNDKWGFTLGFSPDGLVGDEGLIEAKSRLQKFQVQTILSWEVPEEHDIQVQTGLLVSEREWLDYIQYSAGMPMVTIRVYPDPVKQEAILEAASAFEKSIRDNYNEYQGRIKEKVDYLIPTERKTEGEIII